MATPQRPHGLSRRVGLLVLTTGPNLREGASPGHVLGELVANIFQPTGPLDWCVESVVNFGKTFQPSGKGKSVLPKMDRLKRSLAANATGWRTSASRELTRSWDAVRTGLSIEAHGPRPFSRRCAALRWSSGRGGGSPSPGCGLTSRAHGLPSQSPRTPRRSRRRLRSHHRTAGRTHSPPRQWAPCGGGSSARGCIGAGGWRRPPVTVQGVLEWSWWRGGSGDAVARSRRWRRSRGGGGGAITRWWRW